MCSAMGSIELQGRLALHVHELIWGVDPKFVRYVANRVELREKFLSIMDRILIASVPEKYNWMRLLGILNRKQLLTIPSYLIRDDSDMDSFVYHVLSVVNSHDFHGYRCYKGRSGKQGMR